MNSLLWKQWHENKRYLAAFMAWTILGTGYAIGYELGHRFRAPVGQFSGLALFYTIFTAVILAMRTARGEHTDGTHSFSASLPVSVRRIAAIRILGAAATMALPILVSAALMTIALSSGLIEQAVPRVLARIGLLERETATLTTALGQLWSVAAIATFGGLELLLLLSVVGCWLRNQSQIGLLGAVTAFGSIIASGLFWFKHQNPSAQLIYGAFLPQSLVAHWGYGSEKGSYVDHEIVRHHWIALGLALPLLVLLGRLFVSQYGSFRRDVSLLKPGRLRVTTPAVWSRIQIRHPRRFTALIWSELRQSLPLAIFGLLLAFLMSIAEVLTEDQPGGHSFGASILMNMPHSTWAVATLWAIVVGSSLYSAELGPGLGSFWRSRPISPVKWFWSKFIIGLLAILIVLDGITILLSWVSPRESMTSGMSWAYIGCMPIFHAFMYALAVWGTCWLRKPVIGGGAALVGYTILTVAIGAFPATSSFEPINIYNGLLAAERAGQMDFTRHGYPLVYGSLALMILVIALFSYRLARPLQPVSSWFTRRGR